jgi:glycosyltransferase involved in cell wall biosynthesis
MAAVRTEESTRRPRLAVAATFPIDPPRGGGQVRAFNLYRELARRFNVELVTLGLPGTRPLHKQLAPGVWERRVPKSAEHAMEEAMLERDAGVIVTDVAMPRLYGRTPEYVDALRESTRGAFAAVACHPYTFPAIREVTDLPVWYEAQDVEAQLKNRVLTRGRRARALLSDVKRVERACCKEAQLVWACSSEDRDELIRRYRARPECVVVVPNGIALEEVRYVSPETRRENKRRLGMAGRSLAVFIASWHEPNVIAAQALLGLATRMSSTEFMIVGSVGLALHQHRVPDNVELTGTVSSEFKAAVLGVADVALNPVTTGSGTNIKMLDYFAAGVPVISTAFGARGLGIRAGAHYLAAEPDEFPSALSQFRAGARAELDAMVRAARSHVEQTLSWSAIAENLLATLPDGG